MVNNSINIEKNEHPPAILTHWTYKDTTPVDNWIYSYIYIYKR